MWSIVVFESQLHNGKYRLSTAFRHLCRNVSVFSGVFAQRPTMKVSRRLCNNSQRCNYKPVPTSTRRTSTTPLTTRLVTKTTLTYSVLEISSSAYLIPNKIATTPTENSRSDDVSTPEYFYYYDDGDGKSSSPITGGIIAAIVVGAVLFLAIFIIVVVFILRCRRRRSGSSEAKNKHSVPNTYNNLPPPSINGQRSPSVVAPTAPPLIENAYSVANEVTPSRIDSSPWNTGASAGVDNYDFIEAKPQAGPKAASTAASSLSVPVAEPQYAEVNMMIDHAVIDVVVQSPPGRQMPEYAQVNKKKVNSGTGVALNETTTAEKIPEYAQVNKMKRQEDGDAARISRDDISGEHACRPENEPACTEVNEIRDGVVASRTTLYGREADEMDEVTLVDNIVYS